MRKRIEKPSFPAEGEEITDNQHSHPDNLADWCRDNYIKTCLQAERKGLYVRFDRKAGQYPFFFTADDCNGLRFGSLRALRKRGREIQKQWRGVA